jgi:Raf kinase inhibitor-like YbhB/YbcL family protein
MKLTSSCFTDGGKIPGANAFCVIDPKSHVAMSSNRNPDLSWSGLPSGTKSLALICHDPHVPSKGDDVNQEGKTVPASLPRVDFFHWVLVDLPADTKGIGQGEYSDGITPRGKPGPAAAHGARQGINDYTAWFASDKDMSGNYFGYDGPCPPWNDAIVHHYTFALYALDIAKVDVHGNFGGADVRKAIHGHVLGEAKLTGTYTLTPQLA